MNLLLDCREIAYTDAFCLLAAEFRSALYSLHSSSVLLSYHLTRRPLSRAEPDEPHHHSWDHIDLKKESKQNVEEQIGNVQKIVKETIGTEPKFFRPPFGSGGDTVKDIAKDHDLLFMTWSNGSLDWESKNKNKPDAVVNNVLEQLHPGSNILMHELPWTVEALDSLLTKLESKGYGFVDPGLIEPKIR